jgi:hypothetical protein
MSQEQSPSPIQARWKLLRTHPVVAVILSIGTLIGGAAALAVTLSSILGGPLWPTSPEIHPKDTTDGSSLILPFVIRNASVFIPIKNANFICRVDLILKVDSWGRRVTVRGFDIPAGTYDIPAGGAPINIPCDTSNLLHTRANGSLTLGDTDTAFVYQFPSGAWLPQVYTPPLTLLKTCIFIEVSYSAIGLYPRQLTAGVFQWPEVPGAHQWAEGAVGGNLTLPEDFNTGAFFGPQAKGNHPLRCSEKPLPYYSLIHDGKIQFIPIIQPPLTGEFGMRVLPPYL